MKRKHNYYFETANGTVIEANILTNKARRIRHGQANGKTGIPTEQWELWSKDVIYNIYRITRKQARQFKKDGIQPVKF